MDFRESYVKIPVEKYEELVRVDTKVDVLISMIAENIYMTAEEALLILGYDILSGKIKEAKNERGKLSFAEMGVSDEEN